MPSPTDRHAVLFTDICGSKELTQVLGDAAGTALVREHDVVVQAALEGHDGTAVKHTGDGMMASFRSVTSAVRAATDIQRALDQRNGGATTPILVRIGISTGEQLAARLCDCSDPGAITVSMAVHELCVGKGIDFEAGRAEGLEGFAEPVTVYGVGWR